MISRDTLHYWLARPAIAYLFIVGRVVDRPWAYTLGLGPEAESFKALVKTEESNGNKFKDRGVA